MDNLKCNIEVFANSRCQVGENPLWCEAENSFYWLDLRQGHIYRNKADGGADAFEVFNPEVGMIGGMAKTFDGKFLLFAGDNVVWKWSAGAPAQKIAQIPNSAGRRFNDVIASPEGGVFCTVAPADEKPGQLWYFAPDKTFSLLDGAVKGMPNGMGFSPDLRAFYFTVSDEHIIYKYNFDGSKISGRRVFVKVPDDEGKPDGMAVDSSGCVYSAQWDGYRLVKYSPNGEKLAELKFPIAKISCPAFGGKGLNKLAITTANRPWSESEFSQIGGGKIFLADVGSSGMPEFSAKI